LELGGSIVQRLRLVDEVGGINQQLKKSLVVKVDVSVTAQNGRLEWGSNPVWLNNS